MTGVTKLSYMEALQIIRAAARSLPAITVPLGQATGLVLAADVVALNANPMFDNSAMDGFALRAADAAGTRLTITGTIAAGDTTTPAPVRAGEAAAIMTGARVPEGADTVVPVEDTERDGATLILKALIEAGRHIRKAGSDFKEGDLLMPIGSRLAASTIPALAAAGIGKVQVIRRPVLGWISTGRELVDDPDAPLAPGQIRNSSGPYGAAITAAFGCDLAAQRTVGDDGDSFRAALEAMLEAGIDMVVSTGAVSVGQFDFVRSVLEAMGAEILLHRVKVRPGKPVLFARLPDGRPFFGLPGNPASTAMGFRMFVVPYLRAAMGLPAEVPIVARLAAEAAAPEGLTVFLKARLRLGADGVLAATPLAGQESYKIAPMTRMNAWLVHPEGCATLAPGTLVSCYPATPDWLTG
ncbi:molybdopterin molybdotransferase MoeA [Gimibacter soli]|uniref:Molybdopterin molybdenumtransferase n=1 Tax=Gimibacter soli TaxID=3024400 RepID=A0AAE9XRW5_9PROT|nr:gephyrin-like molybdotransferase Glp [Gimibacter soli]WCL53830.1 molybdopterin molybdotransferase MoeA [Gimibacter soli]